jgi:hypothetical protein
MIKETGKGTDQDPSYFYHLMNEYACAGAHPKISTDLKYSKNVDVTDMPGGRQAGAVLNCSARAIHAPTCQVANSCQVCKIT